MSNTTQNVDIHQAVFRLVVLLPVIRDRLQEGFSPSNVPMLPPTTSGLAEEWIIESVMPRPGVAGGSPFSTIWYCLAFGRIQITLYYIYIRLHPFMGPSSVLVDKYQNITMIGLACGSTIDNCGIFWERPKRDGLESNDWSKKFGCHHDQTMDKSIYSWFIVIQIFKYYQIFIMFNGCQRCWKCGILEEWRR